MESLYTLCEKQLIKNIRESNDPKSILNRLPTTIVTEFICTPMELSTRDHVVEVEIRYLVDLQEDSSDPFPQLLILMSHPFLEEHQGHLDATTSSYLSYKVIKKSRHSKLIKISLNLSIIHPIHDYMFRYELDENYNLIKFYQVPDIKINTDNEQNIIFVSRVNGHGCALL